MDHAAADVSWINSELVDAPHLRSVKTYLQKGGLLYLANADASEIVSAKQWSGDRKATSRLGAALSVAPIHLRKMVPTLKGFCCPREIFYIERMLVANFSRRLRCSGWIEQALPKLPPCVQPLPDVSAPKKSWFDVTSLVQLFCSFLRRVLVSGTTGAVVSAGCAVQRRWWIPMIIIIVSVWGLRNTDFADSPVGDLIHAANETRVFATQTITTAKQTDVPFRHHGADRCLRFAVFLDRRKTTVGFAEAAVSATQICDRCSLPSFNITWFLQSDYTIVTYEYF